MQRAELSALFKKLEFKGLLAALEQSRSGVEEQELPGMKEPLPVLAVRELKSSAEVDEFLKPLEQQALPCILKPTIIIPCGAGNQGLSGGRSATGLD
jgi:hypothetical protein